MPAKAVLPAVCKPTIVLFCSSRGSLLKPIKASCCVVDGSIAISFNGEKYDLTEGGYAYLPAGLIWKLRNETDKVAKFHWIRKSYQYVDGLDKPEPVVTNASDIEPTPMPDTDGKWTTTRFVDPADIRHDMHVTIVTLQPGAVIPFCETHVMEHGLYVLNGKAVYRLNQDWVEVEAGDYMLLRAFCPQACYAGGPDAFQYLLYKDVVFLFSLPIAPSKSDLAEVIRQLPSIRISSLSSHIIIRRSISAYIKIRYTSNF